MLLSLNLFYYEKPGVDTFYSESYFLIYKVYWSANKMLFYFIIKLSLVDLSLFLNLFLLYNSFSVPTFFRI